MAESRLSRPTSRGNPIPLPGFEGKRRTPLLAIRAFCVECMGGSAQLVAECASTACPYHGQRMGTIEPGADRRLLRVIKSYCAGQCLPGEDPAGCSARKEYLGQSPCPCWPYRLGRNPFYSDATREMRRRQGLQYGFGTVQDTVSRSRIDEMASPHNLAHHKYERRPFEGQEASHE